MAVLSPKPDFHVAPIVMGVDPGSRVTGFGVITQVGSRLVHIWSGAIQSPRKERFESRLEFIYEQLLDVIRNTSPSVMAIESAFFGKNIQSTITLSHARAMPLLAAAKMKLPVVEYSPMEVKKSVVGVGRATKDQVSQMIRHLLPNRKTQMGDLEDISDALAVALCHLNFAVTTSKIPRELIDESRVGEKA